MKRYVVTYLYHKKIANIDFDTFESAHRFYCSHILSCKGIYEIDELGSIKKII